MIEGYFAQTNYKKDPYLKSLEGADKWIDLEYINKFGKVKKFNLTPKEIYLLM